jgi:hypothetical protein
VVDEKQKRRGEKRLKAEKCLNDMATRGEEKVGKISFAPCLNPFSDKII